MAPVMPPTAGSACAGAVEAPMSGKAGLAADAVKTGEDGNEVGDPAVSRVGATKASEAEPMEGASKDAPVGVTAEANEDAPAAAPAAVTDG
ncbi:hypothetical protein D3C73_1151860 [compost metagenome]